jgi:hypothetical protein
VNELLILGGLSGDDVLKGLGTFASGALRSLTNQGAPSDQQAQLAAAQARQRAEEVARAASEAKARTTRLALYGVAGVGGLAAVLLLLRRVLA